MPRREGARPPANARNTTARLAIGVLLTAIAGSGGCARDAKPTDAAGAAGGADSASDGGIDMIAARARLEAIATELEAAGSNGERAGNLYEERGDILERLGEAEGAARAFDEAARAHGQSPEASNGPVLRADRARGRAAAARARLRR